MHLHWQNKKFCQARRISVYMNNSELKYAVPAWEQIGKDARNWQVLKDKIKRTKSYTKGAVWYALTKQYIEKKAPKVSIEDVQAAAHHIRKGIAIINEGRSEDVRIKTGTYSYDGRNE